MRHEPSVRWRMADLLIIAAVLCIGIAVFLSFLFSANASRVCVENVNTGEKTYYSLTKDATYHLSCGIYHYTLTVKNGTADVTASDCRDHICEQTPPISAKGESIVCAPAGLVITVTGEGDSDAILG